jgi:hypothetical protein
MRYCGDYKYGLKPGIINLGSGPEQVERHQLNQCTLSFTFTLERFQNKTRCVIWKLTMLLYLKDFRLEWQVLDKQKYV